MKKILLFILLLWMVESCKKSDNGVPQVPQKDIPVIDTKMTAWLTNNNMPGVSLAVSLNGKLVYRKGYGLADKETGDSVTINSRFRIASVSKLITSAAILKLVEDRKISLDDKVFGNNGLLSTTYGTQPYKQYVTDITVNDLLHHVGGGWGQDNDPTFWDNTLKTTELISLTLNTDPLANMPGTKFAYSNFGYLLLARVVEKVSGKTYPQFVKDEIFGKINAVNTVIGGMSLSERLPGEVKYYGQAAQAAYVYDYANLSRADGAYGWVSTPSDLLRFATAVDSSTTRPDILSLQTLQKMVATTPASIRWGWHFGCGWVVEGGEWFWWGTLPSTFSILYRNVNGICIAAIANSRTYGSQLYNDLNSFLDIVNFISTDKTIPWQQDIDQFR